jgi:hypothetical protein
MFPKGKPVQMIPSRQQKPNHQLERDLAQQRRENSKQFTSKVGSKNQLQSIWNHKEF